MQYNYVFMFYADSKEFRHRTNTYVVGVMQANTKPFRSWTHDLIQWVLDKLVVEHKVLMALALLFPTPYRNEASNLRADTALEIVRLSNPWTVKCGFCKAVLQHSLIISIVRGFFLFKDYVLFLSESSRWCTMIVCTYFTGVDAHCKS